MAQRTQMRLHAITGSLSAIDGVASSKAAPADIGAIDLEGVLGQFAGAIKRIHGDAAFTNQDAGKFVHETAQFIGVLSASSDIKGGRDLDIDRNADVAGTSDLHGAVHAYSTLEVDSLATLDSAVVEDLTVEGGLAFNDASGRLKNDSKITWDGTTLSVDGALSVSAGIDLGQLGAQEVVFTDENGKLKTISGFEFTSSSMTLDLNGYLNVANDLVVTGALKVEDLTPGRVVYVGADDALVDSASLTWDESALKVVGAVSGSGNFTVGGNLEVNGSATIASNVTVEAGADLIVQDLTPGRVVYVGASDELVDSAKLTFVSDELAIDGTLDVTGAADVGGDFKVATNKFVVDSTSGNVTAAGDLSAVSGSFSGDLTVSGDFTVNGTTTTVNTTELLVEDNMIIINKNQTGAGVTAGTAGIEIERGSLDNALVQWLESGEKFELKVGTAYADLKIDDLEAVDATLSGDLSAVNVSLTGDLTAVSGSLSGDLDVDGDVTVHKLSIDGDTAQRLYIVDGDGSMKDEAKLIFDGSALKVTGAVSGSGNFEIGGTLAVAGGADFNAGITVDSIKIDNDVAQRLYIVDGDGSIKDEANLIFDGSALKVTGAVSGSGNFQAGGSLDVLLGSDLHGAVHMYDTLRVDLGADLKQTLWVTGAVDMLSTVRAVGNMTLEAQLDVAGASYFADHMNLDKAGAQSILKTGGALFVSASSHLSMSAGGAMVFADSYRDGSSWPTAGIKLASSAEEWTQLTTAFGGAEVSIIGALVAGGAGGKYKKEVSTTIASGSAITAADFVHFDGESADFGTKWTQLVGSTLAKKMAKVDVYVNGQLMVGGSGMDYEIASASGNITFAFPLVADDVIVLVVR